MGSHPSWASFHNRLLSRRNQGGMMRRMKHVLCVATLSFTVLCGAMATSQAAEEKPLYVGVFGGYSFPDNRRNAPEFHDGWSGGLKAGWVLPPLSYDRWFNWELEYWYQNIHTKQQGIGQNSQLGANGHVHTFASNFILRRPTGIFRPYAGVGPSIVFVDFNSPQASGNSSGAGGTSTVAFGANFLVGTRIMFANTLGVFAEYKRNWAIFFDGDRSDLHSNAAVGGLVWDFDYFALP